MIYSIKNKKNQIFSYFSYSVLLKDQYDLVVGVNWFSYLTLSHCKCEVRGRGWEYN